MRSREEREAAWEKRQKEAASEKRLWMWGIGIPVVLIIGMAIAKDYGTTPQQRRQMDFDRYVELKAKNRIADEKDREQLRAVEQAVQLRQVEERLRQKGYR